MEDLIQQGTGLDLNERPVTKAEVGHSPRDCDDLVVGRQQRGVRRRVRTAAAYGRLPRGAARGGAAQRGGRGVASSRMGTSNSTMHAITIPEPGGPDALVWAEVPDPEPGEGEVLVEVAATAVNRADLLQRQGFYTPPPGASPYPGLECSGRIVGARPRGDRLGGRRRGVRAAGAAAATPSRSRCPPASCCRCRTGVDVVDGGGAARGGLHRLVERLHGRPSAPGRDAARARRRPAASARWRSSWRRRSARGSRSPRAARRSSAAAANSAPTSLINYREQDFVEAVAHGDRRPGRRRHPRHHRRQVSRPEHQGARRQRPARHHRPAGRTRRAS